MGRAAPHGSLLDRGCPVLDCCAGDRHCSGEPIRGESDEDAFHAEESQSLNTPVAWSRPAVHKMHSPWAIVVGSSELSDQNSVPILDPDPRRKWSPDHGSGIDTASRQRMFPETVAVSIPP